MSRIALVWELGTSYGHVTALLMFATKYADFDQCRQQEDIVARIEEIATRIKVGA